MALMDLKHGNDMGKLRSEIFSILENNFLFNSPKSLPSFSGKVRILSIDGGSGAAGTLLAAAALARLESSLRQRSGLSAARIADFFDVAAGSGTGGVLAAMLFTRSHDGTPLFSAGDAFRFFANNHKKISSSNSKKRSFFSRRKNDGIFRRMFGDATLRDTVGSLLVPCYDITTCAPFVFSRADAVEMDGYNFRISDVCAATCADSSAVGIASADGRTRIKAAGGVAAMSNPTAAAITHVLNNKQEFPLSSSTDDLLVLSLGVGEGAVLSSAAELVKIAGEGAADMVDQAVAMAFGYKHTTNYLRVKARGIFNNNIKSRTDLVELAKKTLDERSIDSVLFKGSKISKKTNGERLNDFAGELLGEEERRKKNGVPTVALKQTLTPRTSSTTSTTTSIEGTAFSSGATSASTSPRRL